MGALSYLTKCNQRRRAICFIGAATAAVVRPGVSNLNVSLKINVRKCKPGFSLLQPPLYSAVRPMLDRKKCFEAETQTVSGKGQGVPRRRPERERYIFLTVLRSRSQRVQRVD